MIKFSGDLRVNIVIFHSYVGLPEGTFDYILWILGIFFGSRCSRCTTCDTCPPSSRQAPPASFHGKTWTKWYPTLIYWLVVYLPLWKIWVRQLGLLFKNLPNHQPVYKLWVCLKIWCSQIRWCMPTCKPCPTCTPKCHIVTLQVKESHEVSQ